MICIVLGHLGSKPINRVVFTFHLPIFFLISGFFIDVKCSWKDFLYKKIRTLILPYYIACGGVCLAAVAFASYYHESRRNVLRGWLWATLYGAGDNWKEPFYIKGIGAIWFLWALFWAALILRVLIRYTNEPIRAITVFGLLIVAKKTVAVIWLPLSIQAGATALFFLYIGWMFRQCLPGFKKVFGERRVELGVFGIAICFLQWIWFVQNFTTFWLVHSDIGKGAPDIIGSLCGCVLLIFFSMLIDRFAIGVRSFLEALGRNSLLFLMLHIVELNTFPWARWFESARVRWNLSDDRFLPFLIQGKLVFIITGTLLLSKIRVIKKALGQEASR